MNKRGFFSLVNLLWAPVALIIAGLILMVNPDSASALVSKILGWILILCGAGFAIAALMGYRDRWISRGITALLCIAAGTWLLRNPLALAESIGRFAGFLLLIRGIRDIIGSGERPFAFITTIIGAVLILLPMTTSRILLSICGVAVLAVGIILLAVRLWSRNRLDEPDDPNIIDAL